MIKIIGAKGNIQDVDNFLKKLSQFTENSNIIIQAFDAELIDQSAKSIVNAVSRAGAKVSGPVPLPTKINKYTVLRSPHVNKKSREQFEMRTHKRLIDIIIQHLKLLMLL